MLNHYGTGITIFKRLKTRTETDCIMFTEMTGIQIKVNFRFNKLWNRHYSIYAKNSP